MAATARGTAPRAGAENAPITVFCEIPGSAESWVDGLDERVPVAPEPLCRIDRQQAPFLESKHEEEVSMKRTSGLPFQADGGANVASGRTSEPLKPTPNVAFGFLPVCLLYRVGKCDPQMPPRVLMYERA